MNKTLTSNKIKYILLQMIAFTFVCMMAFLNSFFELKILNDSITIFTIASVVVYEIIIFFITKNWFNEKDVMNEESDEEIDEEKAYNEQYLWFSILLLLDIIFIVSLFSLSFSQKYIPIFLIIGFVIFSILSIFVKPYFGIKNNK